MGGKTFVCLLGVLLSARITLQAATPASPVYVGAAVEYYPVTKGSDGTAIANENVKNYLKFLKKADEHNVDIVVFPEGSLTAGDTFPAAERSRYLPHSSYVPDPRDLEVPCKNESSMAMQALKAVSCAAKQYSTYIVVNLREKSKCTSDGTTTTCSPDGHNLYNTNVVFDRKGTVVARYRKFNLFGEDGFNVTSKPELSTFTTDFNVTFGQFICFDILFEKPALRLLRDANVTDIVFSTMWFSELPFLTAPEIQSAWSYANNVNFLASGYNQPLSGTGGSGIYAGKEGSLVNLWSEKRVNALLIANIPRTVNSRRAQDERNAFTYVFPEKEMPTIDGPEPVAQQSLLSDDISPYTTQLLAPTNGTHAVTLCDRGLCCDFATDTTHIESANRENTKFYRYRFAVFNGVRSFKGVGTGGIEVCSIISCKDDTEDSCAQRFDTNEIIVHPVTFNSIVITGNFTVGPSVVRMPIGINTDIQPLNASDFTFASRKLNGTHVNVKYSLRKSCKGLMTFAIWGRNFTADGSAKTTRSSAAQSTPFVFMLVMLVILGIGTTYAIGPLPNTA